MSRWDGVIGRNEPREVRLLRHIRTDIIKRCSNPNHKEYKNYGGRGIIVCDRWRDSFAAFLDDVWPRPAGMTIDRIDNNGNYEPGNVRWCEPKVNTRNRRTTVFLTIYGLTKPLGWWAELSGVAWRTVRLRLKHGWEPRYAVFVTPGRQNSNMGGAAWGLKRDPLTSGADPLLAISGGFHGTASPSLVKHATALRGRRPAPVAK